MAAVRHQVFRELNCDYVSLLVYLLLLYNIYSCRSVMKAKGGIDIYVRNLSGKSILYNVKPSDTIPSLKHSLTTTFPMDRRCNFFCVCLVVLIVQVMQIQARIQVKQITNTEYFSRSSSLLLFFILDLCCVCCKNNSDSF